VKPFRDLATQISTFLLGHQWVGGRGGGTALQNCQITFKIIIMKEVRLLS
jgi:hypothetical protein